VEIHCNYVWELRSRDAYQGINVKNCVVFGVEINGTGTGEQDYRPEPCKLVSPLPLPCPTLPNASIWSCWKHCGWPIEQFILSNISLGLVFDFCYGKYTGAAKRFVPSWLRVLQLRCCSSIISLWRVEICLILEQESKPEILGVTM
jgi:hypothetical protein